MAAAVAPAYADSMASKYAPLNAFLAALPAAATSVVLTPADVEAIIGEPLPAGAATRMWWRTSSTRNGWSAWRGAGWEVTQATMRTARPTITFTRLPVPGNGRTPAMLP
jgi:hypothetical protein